MNVNNMCVFAIQKLLVDDAGIHVHHSDTFNLLRDERNIADLMVRRWNMALYVQHAFDLGHQ